MLQKISYFNLFLAVVYILVYLKNGNFNSTAGVFVIVIFSWLCLRSFQLANYKWGFWQYLTGLWSLYYVGTVLYGAINVLSSAIEFDFITSDTITYLILSFVLSASVITHFVVYFLKNYRERNTNK